MSRFSRKFYFTLKAQVERVVLNGWSRNRGTTSFAIAFGEVDPP
jgi:hypothetical protein